VNDLIESYCRNFLKENIVKLTDPQIMLFKRMYSHKNLEGKIDEVIDNMPIEKLDWAMEQVQKSVNKKLLESSQANS